jgi:hypothetical protein
MGRHISLLSRKLRPWHLSVAESGANRAVKFDLDGRTRGFGLRAR